MTSSQSINSSSPNHYNGIDIVKLICAYLVLTIHVIPFDPEVFNADIFSWINLSLRNCVCRIAVPFFFVSSGFLLFRKTNYTNLDVNRVKDYCLRNLRLYGTWIFLLFIGGSDHLWYLKSLVIATIVLAFLIRREKSIGWLAAFSIIAYVIGLSGSSYYGFIRPLNRFLLPKLIIKTYKYFFATTRNGVFFGLIFMAMGALFAWKKIRFNTKIAIWGLVISLIMLFAEYYYLKTYTQPKSYDMFISLLPVIFFLFYLCIHADIKDSPVYGRIRTIGVLIYFSHLFVDSFVLLGIRAIRKAAGIDITAVHYIITIVVTTLFALIIERLSRSEKFNWLQYLYK